MASQQLRELRDDTKWQRVHFPKEQETVPQFYVGRSIRHFVAGCNHSVWGWRPCWYVDELGQCSDHELQKVALVVVVCWRRRLGEKHVDDK